MIESHETETHPEPRAGGELRAELAGKSGKAFWKSLEELSGTERFKDLIAREYPSQLERRLDVPERRTVLKLMGASLALAGFSACTRQPDEKIVPYAKNPEALVPGVPLFYATAMPWATGAIGLLVQSHMGRPTKIEGNELHPASLGATDALTQAAVLGLYDPDRSQNALHRGRISTWDDFLDNLRPALNVQQQKKGVGLRILSGTVVSPTLAQQMADIQALYPQSRWIQYEPVNRDSARAGAVAAFGKDVHVHASYDKAKVIVSLECDFLGSGPASVRAAREFTKNRKVRHDALAMNRLYVVESSPTQTGAMADHRLAQRSHQVGDVVRILAKKLGMLLEDAAPTLAPNAQRFVDAVAKDLQANQGASLVVIGDDQPAWAHTLVHAINASLGNVGKTLRYLPPVETSPQATGQVEALAALVDDIRKGRVEVLVMLGGNPVFDAPADLVFAGALAQVPLRAHLAQREDETSFLCDWHVPEAHFLESWSDARSSDGTVAIVQPLIAPLFGGKSAHDVAAAIANVPGQSSYEIVRAYWQKQKPDDFEKNWRRWLHDGVIPDTQAQAVTLEPKKLEARPAAARTGFEVVFRPDPTIFDGRFANNGWLQELSKPLTKVTWDNTVHLSPTTAAKLGVDVGDVVQIQVGTRKISAPVWVSPGHADECATVFFGYGRKRAGNVGTNAGSDAYPLRTSRDFQTASGAELTKTGETIPIATTQEHEDFEIVQEETKKRKIVRERTIGAFKEFPHSLDKHELEGEPEAKGDTSLYSRQVAGELARGTRQVGDYAWGMVIDMNACTACNACVIACQAENNIPGVGKKQVLRGREMQWIRIDRYFEGPKEDPRFHHQPVTCMHCENAPCELVCPVGATTHSPEGLNEMTYNRCVGTRYCSNNCPYKVRRFNFLLYSDYATETLKLQRNPDVTVRSRGVMEKCTYCVQRISRARIKAKKEDRKIQDGEIRTACQQVCPAEAIVFGDKMDPKSAVSKLQAEPHQYGLLEELQTRPRTTYLAKVRNPNPELEKA